MRAKIYVAGPYTKGDVAQNVASALTAAEELVARGFAPFVPHLTHFWHIFHYHPYEFWLSLDKEFLLCCDGLLRLPGVSNGADEETATAIDAQMPVFYSVEDVDRYYPSGKGGGQ